MCPDSWATFMLGLQSQPVPSVLSYHCVLSRTLPPALGSKPVLRDSTLISGQSASYAECAAHSTRCASASWPLKATHTGTAEDSKAERAGIRAGQGTASCLGQLTVVPGILGDDPPSEPLRLRHEWSHMQTPFTTKGARAFSEPFSGATPHS